MFIVARYIEASLDIAPLAENAQVHSIATRRAGTCAENSVEIAPWMGRLVFDPKTRTPGKDVVSIILDHTPPQYRKQLLGKKVSVTLEASRSDYVKRATRSVRFTKQCHDSILKGNIHPVLLDGLDDVGPLESLAGALEDGMRVILPDPVVSQAEHDSSPMLTIARDPIRVTGRRYMAVSIVSRLVGTTDRFQVQHYNKKSGKFDGEQDTIVIPASVKRGEGRTATSQYLADNIGSEWFVYGDFDESGEFVAEALESYRVVLVDKNPDVVVLGKDGVESYIDTVNWRHTPSQKGTWRTAVLDASAASRKDALDAWREGDVCVVMHLFGGIKGELGLMEYFAVTGHFSYGLATVVRDALTGQLCFDTTYTQVYGQNVNSIISGHMKRSCYSGGFENGWLGVRPMCDFVVKLDILNDYKFGNITMSPMKQFINELDVMMARYRVGDGTGAAIVTPWSSCVQDSNQALYLALDRLEEYIKNNSTARTWLEQHPDDPQTKRYRRLQSFGRSLDRYLVPLGIVRTDWRQDRDGIVGADQSDNIVRNLLRTLLSWRTAFPRRAHDALATHALQFGGKIRIVRTTDIGMIGENCEPLAPTTLFGAHRSDNRA